jgi:WD40 repeat protein
MRFWDVAAGRLVRTVKADDFHFRTLAWSPDGTTIAYVTESQQIGLWDVAKGCVAKVFEAPGGSVIAWSPDGKRLASRDCGAVQIWDVAEVKGRRLLALASKTEKRARLGLVA